MENGFHRSRSRGDSIEAALRQCGVPRLFPTLAVVVVFCAGCGGKAGQGVPVSGKVVFKGTGEPVKVLTGGHVILESVADAKIKPVGEIEDDGVFNLSTIVDGVSAGGVPPGQYRVRIAFPEDAGPNRLARAQVDARYTAFDKSGLTVTIAADQKDAVTIEIDKRR